MACEGQEEDPGHPGHESGEGPYLCDEAVRLAAEWASDLGDFYAEELEFRPTQVVLENLLAGREDCLPDWAEAAAVAEKTQEVRTALDAMYESAWGRPPSEEECWGLMSAARKKHATWIA